MAFTNVLLVSGSANFSTRDVWDGYRTALEAEGIRVIPYPTFSFLKVLSPDSVCNDILGTALDLQNEIDGVIFVDGLYFRGQRARLPRSLRKAGLPTALIATDDPYEAIPHLDELYTYRFTNEIRCAQHGVYYLPTATLPQPQVPRVQNPRYDLSFVGTVFEDRIPLLLRLAEHCERAGRRFLIAGKWPGGTDAFQSFVCTEVRQRTIDTLEKWEIYSQSRLTINLFRQSEQPADSPSPRIFEVTAFGHAALLTGPTRQEVTRIFKDAVFHFDDAESAIAAVEQALSDESTRIDKSNRAQAITLAEHLYEHRARTLVSLLKAAEENRGGSSELAQDRLAWVIGCGRTGSTWLAEMLGDLPGIRRWHEPYFGRFFQHVADHPEDLQRKASFFFEPHRRVWLEGLRKLFFDMVRVRFPQFGRQALVVKEVNTPEIYPWLQELFPQGKVLLLVRDPFDILDSYLDLQKPNSWNQSFGSPEPAEPHARVRQTALHIRNTLAQALRTYDAFPAERRLMISYESLLQDPAKGLIDCAKLLSVDADSEVVQSIIARRAFEHYEQTGPLQFRRHGQAGIWRTSGNFNDRILELAEDILGPLRGRLGYSQSEPRT